MLVSHGCVCYVDRRSPRLACGCNIIERNGLLYDNSVEPLPRRRRQSCTIPLPRVSTPCYWYSLLEAFRMSQGLKNTMYHTRDYRFTDHRFGACRSYVHCARLDSLLCRAEALNSQQQRQLQRRTVLLGFLSAPVAVRSEFQSMSWYTTCGCLCLIRSGLQALKRLA